MTISLKHNYQSAVADSGDTTLVQPSDWNAEHVLTLATARLVGRTSSGAGAAEEISVGSNLNLSSGTLNLAAAISASTSLTTPLVNGGTTASSSLTLQSTSGIGTTDNIQFKVGNNGATTAMTINTSGNVGIGTSSPTNILQLYNASSTTLSVTGDGVSRIYLQRSSTDPTPPNFFFYKTRGNVGTPTAVATNDLIGNLNFQGFGGTNIRSLASIVAAVETYTSDTNISSFLTFSTTPSGSITPTERMRIDSSGNVGIGTSSPNTYGKFVSVNSADATVGYFWNSKNNAGSSNLLHVQDDRGFGGVNSGNSIYARVWSVGTSTGNILSLNRYNGISDIPVLIATIAGNVGIGAASPSARLDVDAGSTALAMRIQGTNNPYLSILDNDNSVEALVAADAVTGAGIFGTISNHATVIRTNNTERMRINSSGNVGIGTTTPNSSFQGTPPKLNIEAARTSADQTLLTLSHALGTITDGDRINIGFDSYSTSSARRTIAQIGAIMVSGALGASGALAFYTNTGATSLNERMRIDSSGNVGIGTSSPNSNNKLEVSGNIGYSATSALYPRTASVFDWFLNKHIATDHIVNQLGSNNSGNQFQIGTLVSGSFSMNAAISAGSSGNSFFALNGGNVGIGTSSPAQKLHVASASSTQLRISDSTAAFYFDLGRDNTDGLFQINGSQGLGYKWLNAGTERMRIHATGGVSINNTTDPGAGNLSVTGQISGAYNNTTGVANTAAQALGTNTVSMVLISANTTLTTTVPPAGARAAVIIKTSGTTTRTVTFGTGFKSQGTLATGATADRFWVVEFVSDGTFLYESGRTTTAYA